ncbi:unnamed protein product [Urochloa humidicola]
MHPAAGLLLLLATTSSLSAAATADFVNYTCSAALKYTDSSPYGKDVASLRSALATPPPANNHWWFRSRTVGQVSGLAMCYADADADAKKCPGHLNLVNSSWYSGTPSSAITPGAWPTSTPSASPSGTRPPPTTPATPAAPGLS